MEFKYLSQFRVEKLLKRQIHISGLEQDCSNSIARPLELLQSCIKLPLLLFLQNILACKWLISQQQNLENLTPHGQDQNANGIANHYQLKEGKLLLRNTAIRCCFSGSSWLHFNISLGNGLTNHCLNQVWPNSQLIQEHSATQCICKIIISWSNWGKNENKIKKSNQVSHRLKHSEHTKYR